MYPNSPTPNPQGQTPTPQPAPPQNAFPNQPYPPGAQQNPYSFITDTTPKPPRSVGPTSLKGRLIVVAIAAVVLIILFIIVARILGSAGQAQTDQYLLVVKKQAEIVRISALAEEKARSLETKSLAKTTRLSMTTAQSDMSKILAKNGVDAKALSKQLSAGKNAKSDELLAEAEKNNRYDETYEQILQNEVNDYKKLLNAAVGGASKQDTQTLKVAFDQATIILPAEQPATP